MALIRKGTRKFEHAKFIIGLILIGITHFTFPKKKKLLEAMDAGPGSQLLLSVMFNSMVCIHATNVTLLSSRHKTANLVVDDRHSLSYSQILPFVYFKKINRKEIFVLNRES